MAAEKRIAVLMTCYNRAGTTLECLRRLFAQALPEGLALDVWLVDDASPDGTGEKVKVAYPQVNVIRGSGSLFWCKGMRLSWDKASEAHDYDFYFWLNDDTMLLDGAIEDMFRDLHACGNAIIAGAVSELESNNVCYGGTDEGGVITPDGHPRRVRCHLNGNVLLVPKEVYLKIGKIDGRYSHGVGDSDYGRMAFKAGIDVYVSSRIVARCSHNTGRAGKTREMGLVERCRLLFSPLGFPLADTWRYRMKFDGVFRALVSCAHVAYKVISGKR